MLTNKQFYDFLMKAYKGGWVYWYGTYGKKCTKELYNAKKRQYPSHYTESRTSKYMKQISEGRRCADCIGLSKAFVWSNGDINATPKYASNGMPDQSANGMFEYAKKKGKAYGKISTIPEKVGIAVRYNGHVGYYVGNGNVIEERGFAYGCVMTKLKDRKWTDWYELPGITYSSTSITTTTTTTSPVKQYVNVVNGNYYVRTEGNKSAKPIGIAKKGELLPYLGVTENGWRKVSFKDKTGWISSKAGSIIKR